MGLIDESSENSTMIVRVCAVFLLGAILLSGFSQGALSTGERSINVTMTKIPADGETLTINENVFEFDNGDGVQSGNIPVSIATSLYQTGENLKSAVSAAGYGVQ